VTDAVRAFDMRGSDAAAALDWLHVNAEVVGVEEHDDSFTVWVEGDLPMPPFADVRLVPRAVSAAQMHATGLEHDAPILVATDLLVRPPWVARPEHFRGVELVVPRGGAFGSGEHASTKAALRCLHRTWDAPRSVADVGTGSGILALYALVRGCPAVEACDIDAASVRAASELLPGCRVHEGGADTLSPADCVIANMTAAELRSSMPAILATWTRHGRLVLSGMRAHEVASVVALVPASAVATEVVAEFTSIAFR